MSDSQRMPQDNSKELYLKGRQFLREGNYEEAISQFEGALEIKQDYKDAAFYLGFAWEKQGEILMAQIAYQKAIKIDPHCRKSWESLYNLYEKMKNLEEGFKFFEGIYPLINKQAFKFWLLEKFALIYMTEGKLERAEDCYRELLKLRPGYKVAVLNLGKVYRLGERKDEKALDILKRAFEIDNSDNSLVLYIARVLRMSGQKDEFALRVYKVLFKIDPMDQQNNIYLKNIFLERDETQDPLALELYNYFIKIEENKGELYFHRGLILKNRGKWDKAIEDFQRAIELGFSLENHWPRFELSYCFYKIFDYRKCAEELKTHIEAYPEHSNGWKMAKKVFFSKELDWTIEDFPWAENIAFMFPSDQSYLRLANYARNTMKDISKAENLYMKALKHNPNLLAALESLEKIYEGTENWVVLTSIYSSQLVQFSSKPKKKIYYLYKMAELNWLRLKDYDKAEELFAEILKINPQEQKVYLEMSRLLKNKKDFKGAKEKLRGLIQKEISYEDVYPLLASLLVEEGKIWAATQVYSILKLLFPDNKSIKEFFSEHSLPAIKEALQWERENEDLLVHQNEKSLLAFLTWARIWCEKLYSPQVNSEILRNATLVNESHYPHIKDLVSWCSKKIGLPEIPSYVYYGKKNSFTLISCISPDDSYIIFHEDFLKLLSDREILFLIAHELAHIKREHHLYYRIKERVLSWTLGMTSNILFSKIPIPVPSVWKNWAKSKDLAELDFDRVLLGLDFTADRYGLFFCSDIGSASSAIWKKYAFSRNKKIEEVNFKELITSKKDKEVVSRLLELWTFALSYEYEAEVNPVTIVKGET